MQPPNYAPNFRSVPDLSRGRSGCGLGRVPWNELLNNPDRGVAFFDDFETFPHITTPTITTEAAIYGKGGYKAFGSSGGTITSGTGADTLSTNKPIGEIILTESDDNQGVSIATIALPFRINNSLNQNVAFGTRIKVNSIVTLENGTFFGLVAQQTLSATVPIAAAGTLADNNFVGFHKLEASTTNIATVYKADGVTQVTGSDVLSSTSTGVIAADTYFKLECFYDVVTHLLHWYYNGMEVGTPYLVTATAGNPFPNDVNMGLCLGMLCGTNNDSITTMDWWGAAQWTP